MFNLSNFQRRNERLVLQYFETADSSKVYSYADLYRQSLELSTNLQKILSKTANNSSQSSPNYSIAILLPVHSPALLPAIVG